MTIVADDGAGDDVIVGVGVGDAVAVGVAVGEAEFVGVGDVVSAGLAGIDAPATVSEVTKPPEIAVAAASAVIKATLRQSPALTR